MIPHRFTVRVYGFLRNEQGKVLLSKEKIADFEFTKFPGGGLEFGEGTKECLEREFKEETRLEIKVEASIYTSDFFVQSKFDAEEQVIGIYYNVAFKNPDQTNSIGPGNTVQDFRGDENMIENVWVELDKVGKLLSFEMDRVAFEAYRKYAL